MDATDRICRMLDERGIEYVSIGGITNWGHAEFDELADGSDTRLIVLGATPEQAIAATLGRCDTMGLCPEWEQVLFANVSDEVAQDNLNECVHDLLDKAATMGVGTLTAEQVRECSKGVYFEGYSDGATHRVNGIEETDWQAITDELNATVGAGTCHIEVHDNLAETEGMGDVWLECDECHWQMPLEPTTPRFKYCPNCGRRCITAGGGW